jgi:hypothetical protein
VTPGFREDIEGQEGVDEGGRVERGMRGGGRYHFHGLFGIRLRVIGHTALVALRFFSFSSVSLASLLFPFSFFHLSFLTSHITPYRHIGMAVTAHPARYLLPSLALRREAHLISYLVIRNAI